MTTGDCESPAVDDSVAKIREQSFDINVAGHRSAQRDQKIRNLANKGSTAGERSAAAGKLKGPTLPLANSYEQDGEVIDEVAGALAANAIRLGLTAGVAAAGAKLVPAAQNIKKKLEGIQQQKVDAMKKYEQFEIGESAAWTRSEGKNKSGGLNEKGRKSYERENPGSDLKAPSKEPGNKRRASFCARMKGMKSKLTSAKTASDPDSRINKSLRAWNC